MNWSSCGSLLASCSDDKSLCIWHKNNNYRLIKKIKTKHLLNIFDAKFVNNTNNTSLITCGADGKILVHNVFYGSSKVDKYKNYSANSFECCCHSSSVKNVSSFNNPNLFLSCAEDATVRMYDLRVAHTCRNYQHKKDIILNYRKIRMDFSSLSINSFEEHYFLVCGRSPYAYLNDVRYCNTLEKGSCYKIPFVERYSPNSAVDAASCVKFNPHKRSEFLASWLDDHVYRFDMLRPLRTAPNMDDVDIGKLEKDTAAPKEKHKEWKTVNLYKSVYKGHCNIQTLKNVNYFGSNSSGKHGVGYVVSGSDDGNLFVWDQNGKIVQILKGDGHIVNCVEPHPFEPLIASSGIDRDIKLFSPSKLKTCNINTNYIHNERFLREGMFDAQLVYSRDSMINDLDNITSRNEERRIRGTENVFLTRALLETITSSRFQQAASTASTAENYSAGRDRSIVVFRSSRTQRRRQHESDIYNSNDEAGSPTFCQMQ